MSLALSFCIKKRTKIRSGNPYGRTCQDSWGRQRTTRRGGGRSTPPSLQVNPPLTGTRLFFGSRSITGVGSSVCNSLSPHVRYSLAEIVVRSKMNFDKIQVCCIAYCIPFYSFSHFSSSTIDLHYYHL